LWVFVLLSSKMTHAQTTSSCFSIESIQADACGSDEGQNEMVRFLVGPAPLNVADLSITWATTSNTWEGICQNASTAAKVVAMNATIQNCGLLKEPTAGILPANSKVLLISGINFNPSLTTFAGLSDTLYVIFHCSTFIGGNFSNSASTIRYFTMTFSSPASCTQTVSYLGTQLVGGDGALVNYDQSGNATYSNNGCTAPFPVYDPSWTPPAPMCSGAASVDLNTLVTGTPGGSWSGPGVTGHTFSPAGLIGPIDITYSFSPNCANAVSETQTITVTAGGNSAWTPTSVCSGNGTINLNTLITGATGGTWSGTGVTGNTFNPTGLNGPISITYSVGTGVCLVSNTQNITVTNSPDPSWAFVNASICSSDAAINLNTLITGATGGTWSGNGVSGTTFSPAGLNGTQTITYTVGSGTCAASSAHPISVVTNADPSWSGTSICAGAAPLNLTTLVTGTTGGSWSGPGVSGTSFDPAGLIGNQLLTYSVGIGTCLETESHSILVLQQAPALTITGDNNYCSGEAITLLSTNPDVGNSVKWYNDASLSQEIGNGSTFMPGAVTATYYAVQGGVGCVSPASSFTVTVNQTPQPPIIPAQTNWCTGTPLPMISLSGAVGTVNWYAEAALVTSIGTGTSYQVQTPNISSYFVTATQNGCTSAPVSTNFISGSGITAQILGSAEIRACLPTAVQLQSADASNNFWSTGATTSSITVTQAGTYMLTRIGFCNTAYDTVTVIDISVNADFNVELAGVGMLPLDVTVFPLGNEADECDWMINGIPVDLPANSTFTFTEESEQLITHVCTNNFGCRDTANKVIAVEIFPELYVPNSFTPNGDGLNDAFGIVGYHIEQLNLVIFDRWGEEIYVVSDPQGSWNGSVKSGEIAPDGLYVYSLSARDKNSKPYRFYGTVLLMR
jgi:gliding motility-associated-like protein